MVGTAGSKLCGKLISTGWVGSEHGTKLPIKDDTMNRGEEYRKRKKRMYDLKTPAKRETFWLGIIERKNKEIKFLRKHINQVCAGWPPATLSEYEENIQHVGLPNKITGE